jgi:hypothetical protein
MNRDENHMAPKTQGGLAQNTTNIFANSSKVLREMCWFLRQNAAILFLVLQTMAPINFVFTSSLAADSVPLCF